jgi:aspartyl aminopeptidase
MPRKHPSKKELETLREKLTYAPRLVWDAVDAREKKEIFHFGEAYKSFLDQAKTEREAVSTIRRMAEDKGFSGLAKPGKPRPFFRPFREKSIALVKPGKTPPSKGIRLIVSHIDAPRLDLKQNPLYEDVDLSFLKTHYYGGIKKFQWLARPLAIHGRIVKADGGMVDLSVGEEADDPVFTVLDLLPHLAGKVQYDKKFEEAIVGEKLNVIVGSLPIGDKGTKERFKLALLNQLHETHGLVEEDLVSAELEVVPAGRARDVGWDRALVGGYGQDDRASAFTSLHALLDTAESETSAVALFVDKEEIGSEGATGAKSKFLETVMGDLLTVWGREPSTREIYNVLSLSRALSADVSGPIDPDYQEVHEKRNAARMGYGVCLTKFTGHRGKIGANDADAEYLGWIRRVFNRNKVVWQTGELGKVDEGGGGTVAKFLAVYGMQVVDCGPPVLSMHSPFEISHKGDIFMAYRAFKAFLESREE